MNYSSYVPVNFVSSTVNPIAHQIALKIPDQQATDVDWFEVGFEYLANVRSLALSPDLIDPGQAMAQRIRVCEWIGEHIYGINLLLNAYLYACHQCFEPYDRPNIRILAAPLAAGLGLDGLCNIFTDPITMLIDVGRVDPADWICVVAHEYAHAYIGQPGHTEQFQDVLNHLCLGLGLEPFVGFDHLSTVEREQHLQHWPRCQTWVDSLAVWQGQRSLILEMH